MASLDQILSLVLEFKRQVLHKLVVEDGVQQEPEICSVQPEDVDYRVPKIHVQYQKEEIT